MKQATCDTVSTLTIPAALIVSGLRYLRESVADVLNQAPGINVCGQAETIEHAMAAICVRQPDLVLVDAGFPDGARAVSRLGAAAPAANIVLLGLVETEENMFAWAQAGVVGYVPSTASLRELVCLVSQIGQSRQAHATHPNLSRGAALVLHAPAWPCPRPAATPDLQLTRREQEVLQLVGAGLSNKTIARRLEISLGTTKSHVHNLLAKLRMRRRADMMLYLQDWPTARRPTAI